MKPYCTWIVGSPNFLNERSTLNGRQRSSNRRNRTGRLHEIAAGDIVVLCHVGLPEKKRISSKL